MKRVLVLTAKESEVPFILEAKKQGHYVITTGNNPSQVWHKYADEYVPFDYSDYEGLTELARNLKIDAVFQGCSDNCALSAAYVGEKLGLKGHDTFENAQIIHRKDKFKQFVKEYGIKSPVAESFSCREDALLVADKLQYPVIIKPTNRAGGQGVGVATDRNSYAEKIRSAFDMSPAVVVEPYINGTLHSLDTFIIDGKVVAYGTANDYSYKNIYMTNTGLFPADNWEVATKQLIPEVEKVAQTLGLVDGQLHLQYIMSNGEAWIIEMMRRSPGNHFTDTLGTSIGLNWQAWVLRAEMGENCNGIPRKTMPYRYYSYHSIMADRNGVYGGYEIDDVMRTHIFQIEEWCSPGHVISDFTSDKFGSIQCYFDTQEEAHSFMKNINSLVKVCVVS